jgi:predicted O-methyltransferase YrrM
MNLTELLDALSCLSLKAITLMLRSPSQARRYISQSLKLYDELAGRGLPARTPVTPKEDATVTIPAFHSGGGMSFEELVLLARAVKVLKPKAIFEIGSYNGLTTALFVLNSESSVQILTLDLPSAGAGDAPTLSSDRELVASRHLLEVPHALGLSCYTQLLCDSMQFDPAPYADSIELGLIDAAHDVVHAKNDTFKMATMMSDGGIVFWHDYGGKGSLRPLAAYLESLSKKCPLYRIRGTSLAWAPARELKRAVGQVAVIRENETGLGKTA